MKQSLTEQVVQKLKRAILAGEYRPGERLPTLREMSELYGVSRSVINAAAVDLEASGYVRTVPTKWIEVADWRTEGNLSVLSDLVRFGLLDAGQLDDLLEARRFLELECAALACVNAAPADVEKLTALIKEEEKERDPEKRSRLDLRFHLMICRMSGNTVYGIIMNAFEESSYPLIALFYRDPEVYGFVLEKHRLIARAIKAHRAAQAQTQMRLLLEHGETILKKLYKGGTELGSKV